MTLLIREATPDDALSLAEIHATAWQAAYPGLVPADQLARMTVENRLRVWTKVLAQDNTATPTVLALSDNRPAGFICLGPTRSPELGYAGEIWAINLHPDFWGKGIAEPLLRAGVERLISLGYKNAHLWVVTGNSRARRFYERTLGSGVLPESEKTIDGIQEIAYGWNIRPE